MNENYTQISSLMQQYFDGLYHSNTELLTNVFHPQARYSTVSSGELVNLSMPEYFEVVSHRQSPSSKGQQRCDEVLAIEFIGPTTALVKARCVIVPKHFTDLLNLIYVDGKWQIISKVFHYHINAPSN